MQKDNSIPEAVCIGFFCHDVQGDIYILGGTASYSSLMLQQLGKQTAVLTSVGEDFLFFNKFSNAGLQVKNKVAAKTTVFNNVYDAKGDRTQYMYARAATLTAQDIPTAWKKTPLVKLCLIADEADPSLLSAFPNAIIGATIQGWLRQWDENGKIAPKAMNWELLRSVDVVLFSEDDLKGFEEMLPTIVDYVPVTVMTKGKHGASVFYKGIEYDFPAFPVTEVDPTGAGDVFAATFLYQFAESQDIHLATAYAHAAASYVVEGVGVQLPSKAQVESRFLAYQGLYVSKC